MLSNITDIVLIVIMTLLFAIFIRLGGIMRSMLKNQRMNAAYNGDHHAQRDELLETYKEGFEDLSDNLKDILNDIKDIKEVSEIYYKYKLPDVDERKLFDQIKLDEEISNRVYSKD